MAQKFIGLDDAAEQLGVSKESLNDLREAGKLRGYRDGTSWKFRSEDIDKFAAEGVPGPDSDASGVRLAPPSDDAADITAEEPLSSPEASDVGLDEPIEEETVGAGASDLSLDDLEEPTVPVDMPEPEAAEGSDVVLDLDESSDVSDSILLSEAEFGESTDRPPSTIIGKADLGLNEDLDLILASEEDKKKEDSDEYQLRSAASDVLSSEVAGSGVLDIDTGDPSAKFEGLDELEIDLEAESSRILSPEDVDRAQKAGLAKKAGESSGFELASTESDAGLTGISGLDKSGKAKASDAGLTGLSSLEIETEDDDDDMVLGDGSDVTLSSDSGINLVSPSDSGLALDEVPIELSGSAIMGSGLELGGLGDDMGLDSLGGESDKGKGEDFLLTPISEEAEGATEESSSQIIDVAGLEEEAGSVPIFSAEPTEGDMLSDELGGGGGLAAGGYAVPVQESTFSAANVISLALCICLLTLCGMMLVDLTRNIWSWDETYSVNSSLIEGILNLFPN